MRMERVSELVKETLGDILLKIKSAPADVLLAQKLLAILKRPRPMGRDFYDVIFLLAKAKPNYDYLNQKLNIKNGKDLNTRLLAITKKIDFEKMARDVKPFLFNPSDAEKLKLFNAYIKQLNL